MAKYTSPREGVPEEARVLDAKIEDLDNLLNGEGRSTRKSEYHERKRLKFQLMCMRRFSASLHDRMEAWKADEEEAAANAAKRFPRDDP